MKVVKSLLVASAISFLAFTTASADLVKEGEKIFNTKKIGNCLACHAVSGKNINNPGSLGPKLVGLKYYPDDYIYNAIYDIYAAKGITTTAMPAYGKNAVLTDHQIKALVAYLKTVE